MQPGLLNTFQFKIEFPASLFRALIIGVTKNRADINVVLGLPRNDQVKNNICCSQHYDIVFCKGR